MSFRIEVDVEHRLVRICHEGEMGLEEMLRGRSEVGALLQRHGYQRVLVDARDIEEGPDILSAFEVSSTHRTDLPLRVRLALLVNPQLESNARFGENVANNRGFQVRVFLDEAPAIAWLTE